MFVNTLGSLEPRREWLHSRLVGEIAPPIFIAGCSLTGGPPHPLSHVRTKIYYACCTLVFMHVPKINALSWKSLTLKPCTQNQRHNKPIPSSGKCSFDDNFIALHSDQRLIHVQSKFRYLQMTQALHSGSKALCPIPSSG